MTFEESCRILGLPDSAGQEERFQAYADLKAKLNAKLESAPTPGLKVKYRAALERVDEAIERYEAKIDADELPVFREETPVVEETPAPVAAEEIEAIPLEESIVEKKRSGGLIWALGAVVLIGVIVLGSLYWKALQAEKERALAEQQRIAAAQAEAEQSAAAEALEGLNRLRAPYAESAGELSARLTAMEAEYAELVAAKKVADREGSEDEKALSRYRVDRYEEYLAWNRSYLGEHALVSALANVDEQVEREEFGAARLLLASMPTLAPEWSREVDARKQEKYEEPVERFKTRRSYDQAAQRAKIDLARREYAAALSSIAPYRGSEYVGDEAEKVLEETYNRQWSDLFAKAEHAASIGEFNLARSILDSLEGNPEFERESSEQTALVDSLNAEYALELATQSVEVALQTDDFERARTELVALESDPYVRDRVKEDLRRIDALETIWKTNESIIGPSDNRSAVPERESERVESPEPVFDTPPELIRKVGPVYPDLLRESRVEGYVELEFTVELNGGTGSVDVLSSSRYEFELPAIEAVRRWKFKPASREGVAVSSRVRQKVLFNPR